jgi:ATP synthase I chain
MTSPEDASTAVVRNVEYWTAALGTSGALIAWARWGWRTGAGLAAGAFLSWLNYRWLKQGVISIASAATEQAGAENVRRPKGVYLKFFGRFVLLVAAVYVILMRFGWPAVAVFGGLFAVIAATLAAMIVHLLRSLRRA